MWGMDSIFWDETVHDFAMVWTGACLALLVAVMLFERHSAKRGIYTISIPDNVQQDSFGTNSAFSVQCQRAYVVDCDYWDVPEGDQPCWQL